MSYELVRCFFAFMFKFICMALPVLTVEFSHIYSGRVRVQAVGIDINPIRVGSWGIKWFYATGSAKSMPGDASVKSI